MSGNGPPKPPPLPPARRSPVATREARLAAALRANLGRRKAQARGREDAAGPPPPPKPPLPER